MEQQHDGLGIVDALQPLGQSGIGLRILARCDFRDSVSSLILTCRLGVVKLTGQPPVRITATTAQIYTCMVLRART